jgi:hypothetical protein
MTYLTEAINYDDFPLSNVWTYRWLHDNDMLPGNSTEHVQSPSQTASEEELQLQKSPPNGKNLGMDKIMQMTGLEDVKLKLLGIKSRIEADQRRGIDFKKERFSLVLLGNPGTGNSSSNLHEIC